MINTEYLFEKLLSYCKDIQGVDEQVLDAHLQKHGLTLRPDHRSFLLKYGNSNQLLKADYGDCTYAMFEKYTSNPQKYMSGFDELPDGTVFFGQEFSEELLCIENESGKLYTYDSKELLDYYGESIDALLFSWLVVYLSKYGVISSTQMRIVEKDDKEPFYQQHEAYHLSGLDNFFTKYFLKNNQLMRCRGSQDGTYDVHYFQGEILDSIAQEGLLFTS